MEECITWLVEARLYLLYLVSDELKSLLVERFDKVIDAFKAMLSHKRRMSL